MKTIFNTEKAPAPIGPYSQAVKAGNTLYVSGQLPIDPQTGELIQTSIQEETIQVIKNIESILNEAGYSTSDIIKTSIFLSDMSLFAEVNDVYSTFFTDNFPARETIAVKGLPKNANVEISVIAFKVRT